MIALAIVALGRAVAYLPSSQPTFTPALLQEWPVPIPAWGALWGVVGILLLAQAWRREQALALAVMASMSTLWAGVYVWAASTRTFVDGFDTARGSWITAATYIATAVIVVCISRMINKLERGAADA